MSAQEKCIANGLLPERCKIVIEQLQEALRDAADHLSYCGYGDEWEREGAFSRKLPERIEAALNAADALFPPVPTPPLPEGYRPWFCGACKRRFQLKSSLEQHWSAKHTGKWRSA